MNDRTTKTIGCSHIAARRNAIEQYRKQAEGNPNHWAVPIIRRYEAAERKKVSVTRPTRETHVIIGDHDPEPRHDWHGNIPVGTADDGTGRWRDL